MDVESGSRHNANSINLVFELFNHFESESLS